jgi:hypothetical protein
MNAPERQTLDDDSDFESPDAYLEYWNVTEFDWDREPCLIGPSSNVYAEFIELADA